MSSNRKILLNGVVAALVSTSVAQSSSPDYYTVTHGQITASCSTSTCTWTGPLGPPPAVVVTMTEYVTVLEPSTATVDVPVTILVSNTVYNTLTEVATINNTVINPVTETAIETVATTAPIVLTVTTTSTFKITLCETRDSNPTYTAVEPHPTDSTWGCPPGYICQPPQVDCNFERGLPSDGFYCSPDECIPAPPRLPVAFWGPPVTSNESPLTNSSLFFDFSSGYFNMNPLSYDLSYDIFFQTSVSIYTTTIYPAGPTSVAKPKRQAQLYVPAVCYDECNDALLEAQAVGKTPALCASGSAYEVTTNYCEACIQTHTTDDSASFVQVQPQFQQFVDYCAKLAVPTSTPVITQTVTAIPLTQTIVAISMASSNTAYVTMTAQTETITSVGPKALTIVLPQWSDATTVEASSSPTVASSASDIPKSGTITFTTTVTPVSTTVIYYSAPSTVRPDSTLPPPTFSTSTVTVAGSRNATLAVITSVTASGPSVSTVVVVTGEMATSTPAAPPLATFTGAATRTDQRFITSWWTSWVALVVFGFPL